MKTKAEIPIFFSTDDNYIPYLDVAISSLVENASNEYQYRIIVLHTSLEKSNVNKILRNERAGVKIDFVDISHDLERIKARLKDVYHFSIVTYYRLFIASLFPKYDKVIYLDCDIVVLGDISKLYNLELGRNILAAAPEIFVRGTQEFRIYAERALGLDPDQYVNAGVLLLNLAEYRKSRIEERFVEIISKYDFDLLDPDQAYLNYLCGGRIHALPSSWNKEPLPHVGEEEKNIVHYALYKKPWQYDDVIYGEYFWHYATLSPFYDEIRRRKAEFGEAEKRKKEQCATEILIHALRIADSEDTFLKRLSRGEGYGKKRA